MQHYKSKSSTIMLGGISIKGVSKRCTFFLIQYGTNSSESSAKTISTSMLLFAIMWSGVYKIMMTILPKNMPVS